MIHTFLRSIGFRELQSNKELYEILNDVVNHPDLERYGLDEKNNEFASFSKDFGEEFGITVCGNFITEDEFRMEYYYPYLIGSEISTREQVEIEPHAGRQSYAGICDELKLGVAMIFYINNEIDVMKDRYAAPRDAGIDSVVLSALSTNGMVLLPVHKTTTQISAKQKKSKDRLELLQMAREGDTSAMEHLTIRDMDTYSSLYQRVRREDVLSIVESSFIPYGVESDQYVVIGEIKSFYSVTNPYSKENIWIIRLVCNDISFDLAINEKDLMGELQVGRRFKGRIWLQGHLNFGY